MLHPPLAEGDRPGVAGLPLRYAPSSNRACGLDHLPDRKPIAGSEIIARSFCGRAAAPSAQAHEPWQDR